MSENTLNKWSFSQYSENNCLTKVMEYSKKVMEKFLESHGILIAQKSMNPV